MAIFTTDPKHPSSNFEKGVRANFWNIFWQLVVGGVFVFSGYIAAITSITYIFLWYMVWVCVLTSIITTITSYQQYLVGYIIKEKYWSNSGFDNFFLLLFFPIGVPLWYLMGKQIKHLRNRFVYWNGAAYFFRKEESHPREIESYNPFFWLWLILFRSADKYDVHAREIEKEREKEMLKNVSENLPAPDKNFLENFSQEVDTFLALEKKEYDEGEAYSLYHNEENFLEHLAQNYAMNKSMREFAAKKHQRFLQEIKK